MIISSNSLSGIADTEYEGGIPPSSGIVSLQAPFLKEFLEKIGEGPYTLVMGHQDFGIFYQKDNPPHQNIINMGQSSKFATMVESFGDKIYNEPIILWHNEFNLNPNDRYIISTYNFPIATFDDIPPQIVKWYAVNSCVNEIEPLPLGVADPDLILATLDKKIVKQNKLLVCHTNHTFERLVSKVYFMGLSELADWVTMTDEDLTKQEFYELIASHQYVLCPAGNGIDTYRLWETLYLGSTPVLDHIQQPYLQELGAIRFNSLPSIQIKGLGQVKVDNIRRELLDYSYWKERINNAW